MEMLPEDNHCPAACNIKVWWTMDMLCSYVDLEDWRHHTCLGNLYIVWLLAWRYYSVCKHVFKDKEFSY